MAIKKGAFELYTQERKLPDKKAINSLKKSHFFDDITDRKGSQTVHKRFTKEEIALPEYSQDQIAKLEKSESKNIYCHDIEKSAGERERDVSINLIDNGPQTVHKRFTSKKHINSKPEELAKKELSKVESEKKAIVSLSKIVGNQREIIIALYKNIRINKSDITEELTLEMISDLAGVNQKSLKNTLFRLTSAGVIIRADQKVGRGGWVKYQLSPDLINEIQQNDFLAFSKMKK
jgi:hypothetical protein